MRTTLFINSYHEKNPDRRNELEICFENNLKAGFDIIHLIVESKDENYAIELTEKFPFGDTIIRITTVEHRPAFQKYIDISNEDYEGNLIVVMNCDIFIEPAELQKIKDLPWNQKLYVPLSRFELTPEGAFPLERNDSADTFIFSSPCDITTANCPLGYPGIENSLAWKFQEKGYKVRNVSKSIITMHLQQVKINNYRDENGNVKAGMICKEPYAFHPPIKSEEI